MSYEKLSDMEFMREVIAFFGAPRAFQLMGWCLYWSLIGYRSLGELRKQGREADGWNNQSRYNAVNDLERFRVHMVASGKLDPESTVRTVADQVAHARGATTG